MILARISHKLEATTADPRASSGMVDLFCPQQGAAMPAGKKRPPSPNLLAPRRSHPQTCEESGLTRISPNSSAAPAGPLVLSGRAPSSVSIRQKARLGAAKVRAPRIRRRFSGLATNPCEKRGLSTEQTPLQTFVICIQPTCSQHLVVSPGSPHRTPLQNYHGIALNES